MNNRSKVLKASGYSWKDVERKAYKTDKEHFKGIHRYSLLGNEIPELNFHTRYFEIEPGGYSSFEQHRHPHSVIVIRGNGTVILNNELYNLTLNDVIYIAPNTLHQFQAAEDTPLGFLCIVDRYRDKPVIPTEETVRKKIQSKYILKKIKK